MLNHPPFCAVRSQQLACGAYRGGAYHGGSYHGGAGRVLAGTGGWRWAGLNLAAKPTFYTLSAD